MKDFTPKQARRWILQEVAKYTSRDSIEGRIIAEQRKLRMIDELGMALAHPVAFQASHELIALLRSRL